eukprot:CAMPEP_0114540868 /NCGR_PEP_ID=MMETSP0114-20121206/1001_1 /TAXON_ID=31324 /ORGANISM="Goniomonas sp, Strain m" /LENGTH=578 /DNA_ID=CAMNT_0001725067 /DNA_START=75 /DNA_END=1811 /DNA_ORIENTATION=-
MVLSIHVTVVLTELFLILIVKLLRLALRPYRYFFFAIGQFGLSNMFSPAGRAKIKADAEARKQLQDASTYEEYVEATKALDALEEKTESSVAERHRVQRLWNPALVESKMAHMQAMRNVKDDRGLLQSLRLALDRNFGGISHPALYRYTGTARFPQLHDYTTAVADDIAYLLSEESSLTAQEQQRFIREAKQSVGLTALCLSGGGMLALHHCGIVKVLFEQNLLPIIISGSSGGSIIAAILSVTPDSEVVSFLDTGFISKMQKHNLVFVDSPAIVLRRLLTGGVAVDAEQFEAVLSAYLGNYTFLESFHMTGRIVNICVSPSGLNCPIMLNYMNAPNVLLRSAVAGSCALHYVLHPQTLKAKSETGEIVPWANKDLTLVDGSLENDLPMIRLSELFHCSHFIVSQVNPHVTAFLVRPERRRESKLLRVQKWLQLDLLNQLRCVAQLHFFPADWGRHANKMIKQQYTGRLHDVSLWPDFHIGDPMRMIAQPDPAEYPNYLLQGQRAAWPTVERICNQTRVERALSIGARKLSVSSMGPAPISSFPTPDAGDKASMRRNVSDPHLFISDPSRFGTPVIQE